jgi:hypothetical protein
MLDDSDNKSEGLISILWISLWVLWSARKIKITIQVKQLP